MHWIAVSELLPDSAIPMAIQSAIHTSGWGVSQQSELHGPAAREAASQWWQLPAKL